MLLYPHPGGLRYTLGMTATTEDTANGYLIGYARVSTADQNLDGQLMKLDAIGCQKVFTDKATGKHADRAGLDSALGHIRAGDVLVVAKLDRLARSVRDLISIVDDLASRGAHLKVLDGSVDTTTPHGRLAFHIFAAIGEFEREMIVARTRDGLAAAKAQGRVGGRKKKLSNRQADSVRAAYAETDAHGKRLHTVAAIARDFGVTRATVYRYLKGDN